MDAKVLDEILSSSSKNWYMRLTDDVKRELCLIRAGYLSKPVKPTLEVLLKRLQARYKGMPDNTRRLGEFLRNQYNAYSEPSDGADPEGRVEQNPGDSTQDGGRPPEVHDQAGGGLNGGIEYLGSGKDGAGCDPQG